MTFRKQVKQCSTVLAYLRLIDLTLNTGLLLTSGSFEEGSLTEALVLRRDQEKRNKRGEKERDREENGYACGYT